MRSRQLESLLLVRLCSIVIARLATTFQSLGLLLPQCLVLGSTSLELFLDRLRPGLFSLGLVNAFHENALVLEHVTLASKIQLMVQVAIDLFPFTVFAQHVAKHALPPHPLDLLWQACIPCTKSLTGAHMATLALGNQVLADTGARMDSHRLFDHKAIVNQLADILP
jgi:hypothetical protein